MLICITGVDGVGKTTHAKLIFEQLKSRGIECRYEWLRFHYLFSMPLLAICRLTGHTRISTMGGKKCSYHEFYRSRAISCIFPWLLLIDTSLFTALKVIVPMRLGSTIVCDRFIYDTLIDLCIAINDHRIYNKTIGKLFLKLIPRNAKFVILCLDKQEILSRRPELINDVTFDERYGLYQRFIKEFNLRSVYNNGSVDRVNQSIMDLIICGKNDS
jgi:thymidylate kinase